MLTRAVNFPSQTQGVKNQVLTSRRELWNHLIASALARSDAGRNTMPLDLVHLIVSYVPMPLLSKSLWEVGANWAGMDLADKAQSGDCWNEARKEANDKVPETDNKCPKKLAKLMLKVSLVGRAQTGKSSLVQMIKHLSKCTRSSDMTLGRPYSRQYTPTIGAACILLGGPKGQLVSTKQQIWVLFLCFKLAFRTIF